MQMPATRAITVMNEVCRHLPRLQFRPRKAGARFMISCKSAEEGCNWVQTEQWTHAGARVALAALRGVGWTALGFP